MEGLVGPRLLRGTGEVPTSSVAGRGGVVALYFSAHWCGPCQNYTPELAKVYKRAKAKGKALEIIFVSSDRDEASFRQYYGTMPWLALPFEDRLRKEALSTTFQVRGIPSLVLLSDACRVIEANARSSAMLPSFFSTLPRAADLMDYGPLPTEPLTLVVRHRGQEYEIECEPEEGWEQLRMQIYSLTEVPEEQQRLFGLGVVRGPLDDAVPLPRALARGIHAQRGSGLRLADVAEEARSASSAFGGDALGSGHHRGRLDSPCAWVPAADDAARWYQLDLGEARQVAGVVVAPRADAGQWVEAFRVTCAESDAGPWAPVDGGREFDGCEAFPQQPRRALFAAPVRARLVRIEPTRFHKHAALRADVLLQEAPGPELPPAVVVLGNASAEDPFELKRQAGAGGSADKMVEEQHLAMLQAKMSSLPPRLVQETKDVEGARRYEDRTLQRQALDDVPLCALDLLVQEAAAKGGAEGYEVALMRRVLQWFKHGFFEWTNTPPCDHCGSSRTRSVGRAEPTPVERQFGAGIVEVAHCEACGMQVRFPRYNDPSKLLESRQGRCGEWANCFTLVCRALGYEARLVHDWTDHVWTELYCDSLQRWVHADSCEAAFDTPLVYEQGWGKKLTYCLAYARDHAVDVTRRYSRKYPEVLTRRTQFSEQDLKRAMAALNGFAMDRAILELREDLQGPRREALERREAREAEELLGCERSSQAAKAEEQVGRTSGDAQWREQRGELGATEEARREALRLSESGLLCASAAATASSGVVDTKEALKAKFQELRDAGKPAKEAAAVALEAIWRTPSGPTRVERAAGIHDHSSEQEWRPLRTVGPLEDCLHSLLATIYWRDQGWGNAKGCVRAVLRREGTPCVAEADLFGISPHETERSRRYLDAIDGHKPGKGDTIAFEYMVGGGGGHQLHIDSFEVAYSTGRPMAELPACSREEVLAKLMDAYEERVAGGMTPDDAVAALLSDTSAKAAAVRAAATSSTDTPAMGKAAPASPPPTSPSSARATMAAPTPAASKAETQAYLKAKFAEYVQAGMAPAEAAAKMLEGAKRLESRSG